MCDYSLHTAKSRPARVGDRLVTRNFNTGTRGFAAPEDRADRSFVFFRGPNSPSIRSYRARGSACLAGK